MVMRQSHRETGQASGWLGARFVLTVVLLFIVTLACSLPRISRDIQPSPIPTRVVHEEVGTTPQAIPTPTPLPLPPILVETDPPLESEIPLQKPITLYFNQPMDRASVEDAILSQTDTPLRLTWIDEATLSFHPDEPFSPDVSLAWSLDENILAANGLAFSSPLDIQYRTAGYLSLAQTLPKDGAIGVDPTAAIVADFNRPVVPLGVEPDSLPPAFTIEPHADGRSEWLNTSTYLFYPEPALAGGVEYTIHLNPDITSSDGSPLEAVENWSFTTARPRLVSILPRSGSRSVPLDTSIRLEFNQPMDPESVINNFSLQDTDSDISIRGVFTWNDDFTLFNFQPSSLLKRDQVYSVVLDELASSIGGTPLGSKTASTLRTVPHLAVVSTEPPQNSVRHPYTSITIYFNSPIQTRNVLQFITIHPEVPGLQGYVEGEGHTLWVSGNFTPETNYTLTVSPNLPDAWNGRLGHDYVLNFRTLPLEPNLTVINPGDVLFTTPQESSLRAQLTNLPQVSLTLGSLSLDDFIEMISPGGFALRQEYTPTDQRTYWQGFDLAPNQSQVVDISLSLNGGLLGPGLYHLRFNLPSERLFSGPFLLVASKANLTFKLSATGVLVWAVDLEDNTPIPNQPVTVYLNNGEVLASGFTDEDGIFQASISTQYDMNDTALAVLSEPGDDLFALALSTWSQGLDGWNFDIQTDYTPPQLMAYLYTDRPIYRPGQTVFFRAILRQAYNGRYILPDPSVLPEGQATLVVLKNWEEELERLNLPLTTFGSVSGSYEIPPGSPPGIYTLLIEEANRSTLNFQVAEYRKPEIDLTVSFASGQTIAGQPIKAMIQSRYFFGTPASNISVRWALYKEPSTFSLPGYQVGVYDTSWMLAIPSWLPGPFGELVSEGSGRTDSNGSMELDFSPPASDSRQRYTLEVTVDDESGFPVSARAVTDVNPAPYYIGIKPDVWVGQAGREMGFNVQLVDWDRNPAGEQALRAVFQKVIWETEQSPSTPPENPPSISPRYTTVGSVDFATAPNGQARLAFTPPEPGTYQLDVTGDGARTEVLLWVGGLGQAIWPDLPAKHLRLTPFQEIYHPGETAQVFLPNPFPQGSLALVTVERGEVLRYRVLSVEGAGINLSLPLGNDDPPNVYISVTLLGKTLDGSPDYRHGYLSLPVQPVNQIFNLEVTSQSASLGPGEEVTLDIKATDVDGNPVSGEFSLSIVDEALLALSELDAKDIIQAFYGDQPLGVRTGLALNAYSHLQGLFPDAIGGGGGEALVPLMVRERFPDTAFWDAEILTDEDGRAQVTVNLPDNLTTWRLEARGITSDTRVGQAQIQLVTTKDLLVRPVTPRFLVLGDHVLLATQVHNNTDRPLQVEVSLQASGFDIDDPRSAVQTINVISGGRARVEWWGTAQNVEQVELVFIARSLNQDVNLEDAARPASGPIPVKRYTAPQTFATSGIMDTAGQRLEIISLPRSFDPQGGALQLELSTSLAGSILKTLDALEPYDDDFTEQIVSITLSNLQTFQTLREFGIESQTLQVRLDRMIRENIRQILLHQNQDGGWNWWRGGPSDEFITAYILFGLSQASEAGISTDNDAILSAAAYLQAAIPELDKVDERWQLNRLVFMHFALTQAGLGELQDLEELYQVQTNLDSWAHALLALAIDRLSPGDERAQTLLSNLAANANRSATGAHWEDSETDWRNMSSPVFSTAAVMYALAQLDPRSPLVGEATRYLIAHRGANSLWASHYETAWILMALNQALRGSDDLSGDFQFSASLNNTPLAEGKIEGELQWTPVQASTNIANLYRHASNALVIERGRGPGNLYYTAHLKVDRPVESVGALSNGISLQRSYTTPACNWAVDAQTQPCVRITRGKVGEVLTVRLSIHVAKTVYFLAIEDYIPAGAEILDINLKSTKQGEGKPTINELLYEDGWGWWYFTEPKIYDDRISWAAQSLPPGTYELTYSLTLLHPGEYHILPARAWQFYFPEVQGVSQGETFRIEK